MKSDAREAWRRLLQGAPVLALHADRPVSLSRGARWGRQPVELGALSRHAEQRVVALAAFQALLYRYTQQVDLCVGLSWEEGAARSTPEERLLAVRVEMDGKASFSELVVRARKALEASLALRESPPGAVLSELFPEREPGRSPFQVMVVVEPPASAGPRQERPVSTPGCQLALVLAEEGGTLTGWLEYDAEQFESTTVARMAEHYRRLLEAVRSGSEQRLAELELMDSEEARQVLVEWNQTRREYPRESTLHEELERQVERTPDAVAVSFAESALTYRELNERANQLANHLKGLGVGTGSAVGLCVERSLEGVVATLAILKAGGFYVPLDPSYPRDRLALMLEDTQVGVLVAQERLVPALPAAGLRTVLLDGGAASFAAERRENLGVRVSAEHLAYVMYTSGSTGRPKGVCVPHRAVMRLVKGSDFIHFGPEEVFLQVAPISFDASTLELWGSLLNGARLAVCPVQKPSLEELARVLVDEGVTTLWLTAALFDQVQATQPQALGRVRQLLAGGDVLAVERVRQRLAQGGRLVNGYGPTEGTTFTCCFPLERVDQVGATVPIGRPIANTQVYLLDEGLRPVPLGVQGELFAGGDGLAWGYLRRPELTAERFIPNPYGEAGSRLYRTGDLARWREDGTIEFLGRRDTQVKVRGYRIELAEIESALQRHPAVRGSVVLARDDGAGGKRLVAWYVPAEEHAPTISALRFFLAQALPEYMMPSAFVRLEALPLTPNGKVDRGALPAPDMERPESDTAYAAPRTENERKIAELCAQLLGVERVGLWDNFFVLGGHSLLATQLVSRLRERFGLELRLADFFAQPTVAGIAEHLNRPERALAERLPPIHSIPRDQPLPLTLPQEQVWFINQLAPGNVAYNFQMSVRLEGPLDVAVLEQALTELVLRHESLRTTFPDRDGRPVQQIHAPFPVSVPVVDLSGEPAPEERAEQLIAQEVRKPFDVLKLPLVRWRLYRLAPRVHLLLQVEHHFVHDGWSISVVLRELETLYQAFLEGRPSPMPELPVQLADFAAWQRQWFQGEVEARHLAYWKARMTPLPPVLELPGDHPRPKEQSFRGGVAWLELPSPLYRALKQVCQRQGSTFFMMLQTAFFALLHRYTGQTDLCIGTGAANRRLRESEGLVGMIVNTVLLRADVSGDPRFSELLRKVSVRLAEDYAHQDLPVMSLVKLLQPDRDLSRTPLFQIMFSFHDSPMPMLEFGGLKGSVYLRGNGSAKADLNVVVVPVGEQRVGQGARSEEAESTLIRWEYSTDLFEAATIERLAAHYRRLLESVVANPEQRLSELGLLTEQERQQVVEGWNRTASGYPKQATVSELFEAQARKAPEAVALEFDDGRLSYAELERRSNQLAHALRAQGVGPGKRVGLCVERSARMVVGMLGILKVGGAYVPLDASYPRERLGFMVEDSGCEVVLTQQSLAGVLPESARQLLLDAARVLEGWPESCPASDTQAADLAYIIYTSGSTGQPKGVGVAHQAIVRLVVDTNYVELMSADAVAQGSNASFDAVTFEVWGALLNGGRVVGIPREVLLSPHAYAARLRERGVTAAFVTTQLFNQLAREVPEAFQSLRYVLTGGEAADAASMRKVLEKRGGCQLLHVYGPTESTTFATWFEVKHVEEAATTVPIGRPIGNTQAYVLDPGLKLVPVGVAGELCLGGDGLAWGYLGRPELTAERFVPNPYGESGSRLYRTGDMVRWRADGNLEYLGRRDTQVKVRGFRIELGEIEAALQQHHGVKQAAVLAREDVPGNKRLVAYVVGAEGQAVEAATLRDFLVERLPDYMVPSAFVPLERLPLTPNGKLDHRALPTPELALAQQDFIAPRNATEELVARIWSELLGVPRVGAHDDFFALGGHSLVAAQVISRLRDALQVELPLRVIFESRTVETLAQAIARSQREHQQPSIEISQRDALAAQVDQLSDAEVAALLSMVDSED